MEKNYDASNIRNNDHFIWLLLTAAHCNPVLKERVKMALDLALQDQS